MIDKETYKKELKRMFDSLSGGNKSTDRCGIKCSQCPLKKYVIITYMLLI